MKLISGETITVSYVLKCIIYMIQGVLCIQYQASEVLEYYELIHQDIL